MKVGHLLLLAGAALAGGRFYVLKESIRINLELPEGGISQQYLIGELSKVGVEESQISSIGLDELSSVQQLFTLPLEFFQKSLTQQHLVQISSNGAIKNVLTDGSLRTTPSRSQAKKLKLLRTKWAASPLTEADFRSAIPSISLVQQLLELPLKFFQQALTKEDMILIVQNHNTRAVLAGHWKASSDSQRTKLELIHSKMIYLTYNNIGPMFDHLMSIMSLEMYKFLDPLSVLVSPEFKNTRDGCASLFDTTTNYVKDWNKEKEEFLEELEGAPLEIVSTVAIRTVHRLIENVRTMPCPFRIRVGLFVTRVSEHVFSMRLLETARRSQSVRHLTSGESDAGRCVFDDALFSTLGRAADLVTDISKLVRTLQQNSVGRSVSSGVSITVSKISFKVQGMAWLVTSGKLVDAAQGSDPSVLQDLANFEEACAVRLAQLGQYCSTLAITAGTGADPGNNDSVLRATLSELVVHARGLRQFLMDRNVMLKEIRPIGSDGVEELPWRSSRSLVTTPRWSLLTWWTTPRWNFLT